MGSEFGFRWSRSTSFWRLEGIAPGILKAPKGAFCLSRSSEVPAASPEAREQFRGNFEEMSRSGLGNPAWRTSTGHAASSLLQDLATGVHGNGFGGGPGLRGWWATGREHGYRGAVSESLLDGATRPTLTLHSPAADRFGRAQLWITLLRFPGGTRGCGNLVEGPEWAVCLWVPGQESMGNP